MAGIEASSSIMTQSSSKIWRYSVPSMQPHQALVFNGNLSGCPTGHFTIGLSEVNSGKSLVHVIMQLKTGEVIAFTEDKNVDYSQKSIEVPIPFPFTVNKDFKAAIGITKHDFIVAVNGEHVLCCPHEDNSFMGESVNVQVTQCEDLKVEIQSFDVFTMEEGQERNSTVDITKILESENVEKTRYEKSSEAEQAAKTSSEQIEREKIPNIDEEKNAAIEKNDQAAQIDD